jgi:ferric-dicitrate binding protein FerR (iron transport regulator)
MILHATGTAFNVKVYKKDSIIAVTLAKGTIDVSLTGLSMVSLHSGERIHYNNCTFKRSIMKTDPYKWYA